MRRWTSKPDAPTPPLLTAVACVACVAVFAGIHLATTSTTVDPVRRWGWVPPEAIWDGAYWGLITSAFIHVEVWHVAFNVMALWSFGQLMEPVLGPERYLLFFLFAALVSSGAQLATGDPGIGMSGVIFGMFGFLWFARSRIPEFQALSDQSVKMVLFWLVGCIVATELRIMNIGNAAHVGGLLFGIVTALAFVHRRRLWLTVPALVLVVAAGVAPVFGCPWTPEWTGYMAGKAMDRQDLEVATRWFHRTLQLGGDPAFVWNNLARIYGYRHNEAEYANALRELGKVDSASAAQIESLYGTPE